MHEPCMIPEACKDLGRFAGRYRACYMHGLLPIFHAWSMHVPCMESGPISCIFHAWYLPLPCMVQVNSMHDTGVFHAWYRRIPCMVHVYSMCGTGIFSAWYRRIPCMVQACVYRAWYRYSHAWTMYSTGIYTKHTYRFYTCIQYLL